MKPSYEELEAKCLALAAENAGLKASIPQQRNVEFDNDSMDDISLAEDVGFNDAVERMKINMSKTPSTDAFLAEVRARGVDSGIDTLMSNLNHQHQAVEQAINILRIHANRLREGKAE